MIPHRAPTTNELIARRGLQHRLGRDAVDWAIDQIGKGLDSPHLRQLAGMTGIESDFEMDEMVDRTLGELGVNVPEHDDAIVIIAQERARDYLDGRINRQHLLRQLFTLCIDNDYQDELYPFYLLKWTDDDLREEGLSLYRNDATPENFEELLQEEIRTLLAIQHS